MFDETPLEFVEGLFKVDFESHKALLTLRDRHGVNEFLGKDDIVACFTARDEAGLEGVYEVIQERLYSLNQDLIDRLVDGVAKTDGAILMDGFGFANFRDEVDKGGVQVRRDFSS